MKNSKKLLSLALSLILALSCFAGLYVTSSAQTEIDTVTLGGIVAPEIGAHPEFNIYIPAGCNYTFAEVTVSNVNSFESGEAPQLWYDSNHDAWMRKTDTFAKGEDYCLYLSIVPKTGYGFADTSKMTFDAGSLSGVIKNVRFFSSAASDGRMLIEINFNTLATPKEINSVAVTGVPSPIIGEKINVDKIKVSEGFKLDSVSVQHYVGNRWYSFSGNVAADGSYRLVFFMSELYGFTYASSISGTVNGKAEDIYGNPVSVAKAGSQYVLYYNLENPKEFVKPEIKIKNYVYERTVDYATAITFTAETTGTVEGQSIEWIVTWDNGGNSYGHGSTFTVSDKGGKRIDSGYSIQARLWGDYEGGRTIYSVSETEFVHVNSGFMAKLIWFFRHLFNPGAYRISQ